MSRTVEDEKGYEIAKKYLRKKYGDDYVDFLETEGQSYLDGIAEGKPKWHDLIKDPKDLPKEPGECWCYVEYFSYKQHRKVWYNGGWEPDIKVIAWYELPNFEE